MPHIGLYEASISALVLFIFLRLRKHSHGLPLPPGPKKRPLIGNLLDVPLTDMPQTYAKWSHEYNSDILHMEALGKSFVILNSYEAAFELFEKRGNIYSSRPHSILVNELMDLDRLFVLLPYGEKWKERRRTFAQHFSPSNTEIHQPKEMQFIRTRLLPLLLESPENFMAHIRHVIGGILLSLAYGFDTKISDDPWIKLAEEAMLATSTAGVPGKFFVDVLPFLKYVPEWVPGAGFQRQAREWKDLWRRFRDLPFVAAEENIATGSGQRSFVSSCLDSIDEKGDIRVQKEIIQDTAATFFAAGADTTGAALVTFILAMTLYPDVQAKAQAEIDRVLEAGRLPEFSDQNSMPYVTAVMKELARWQPMTPLAMPHLVTENDTYKGYHIPKDSLVISNLWAISRNPEKYPDPEVFKPERFLTPDGQWDPNVLDPFNWTFGFGRRGCVGSHIAMSTMWAAIASILATFTISKAVDEHGKVIEPCVDYKSSTIVALPSPFKCSIRPRSKEAERLIYAAADHSS